MKNGMFLKAEDGTALNLDNISEIKENEKGKAVCVMNNQHTYVMKDNMRDLMTSITIGFCW